MAKLFDSIDNLLGPNNSVVAVSTVGKPSREYTLLYFGAKWCGPCRRFSPFLAKLYRELKEDNNRQDFEVVFVSLDESPQEFTDYVKEMPFPAVPFLNQKLRSRLCRRFRISSVPTLVVLDGENRVLSKNAVSDATKENSITEFPWPSKTVLGILDTCGATRRNGSPLKKADLEALDGFALYFAAKWSPPCRAFTPQLMSIYHQLTSSASNSTAPYEADLSSGGKKKIEFILVSMDRSADDSEDYYEDMPWARVPFQHPSISDLTDLLGSITLPFLVTFKPDGTVINRNARYDAADDLAGDRYPWAPMELLQAAELQPSEAVVDAVNNRCCFILFLNGSANAKTQMSEFRAAASTFHETYDKEPASFLPRVAPTDATGEGEGAAGQEVTTAVESAPPVDLSELPKVNFLVVPENDDDLFSRIVHVMQAQLPAAGKACVLCTYLPGENRTKEVLSTDLSCDSIVNTATKFVKRVISADVA